MDFIQLVNNRSELEETMDSRLLQVFLQTLVQVLAMLNSTLGRTFSQQAAADRTNNPCYKKGVQWARSSDSCSQYVVCGFGEPLATMSCPSTLHWSTQISNCVAQGSRFDDCPTDHSDGGPRPARHHDRGTRDNGSSGYTQQNGQDNKHGQSVDRNTNRNEWSTSINRQRTVTDRRGTGTRSVNRNTNRHYHKTVSVTDATKNRNDDREWNTSNNRQRTVPDRRGAGTSSVNRNKNRHYHKTVSVTDATKNRNDMDRPVIKWNDDTETNTKRRKDKGQKTTSQRHDNRGEYTPRQWKPVSSPPIIDTSLISTPEEADRTTSEMPRWRWVDWDLIKASYDEYPPDYDLDYPTDSSQYPADTEQPLDSDTHPTYTENYHTRTLQYVKSEYPLYDYEAHFSDYPEATAQWIRQTTARTPQPRTTTVKSPFARFATTRRRSDNDNHVWPQYHTAPTSKDTGDVSPSEDNWLTKIPWWYTWGPKDPVQHHSTTHRPWWERKTVLPWLTPSSMWVPQTQPTTTPQTVNTTPDTTKTTATVTPMIKESMVWQKDTVSTVSELPVSATVITWTSPSTPYDYSDNGKHESQWTDWTSPAVTKTTSYPPQSSQQPQVSEDPTLWHLNSTPAYHPECGVAVTNMIVGGLPASEGRWPWVVSLRLTWARRHVCGGTLVHPQWIVTAAHCVFGSQFEEATDWRAVFGNIQPTLTSDVKQQLKIDLIVRHPEFVNGGNYPNDIAMMRLEKPVDVTGFRVRHACLPSRDHPFLSNNKCWIMGWGETKGFEEQSVLQELVVKIRRNQACAARWGWKRILNSHVCVGNGDGGACNGDSGGPLVCLRDGYYYLVGVTSWGVSGCQTTGYPSVFTRVSFYDTWIEGVVQTYSTVDFSLSHRQHTS